MNDKIINSNWIIFLSWSMFSFPESLEKKYNNLVSYK